MTFVFKEILGLKNNNNKAVKTANINWKLFSSKS